MGAVCEAKRSHTPEISFVKTRWLSHAEYLDILCSNLPVLLSFLSQFDTRGENKWPAAVSVKKRLSFKRVSTLHLVLDLLQPITYIYKASIR